MGDEFIAFLELTQTPSHKKFNGIASIESILSFWK